MSTTQPYYRRRKPSPTLGEDSFASGRTSMDFSPPDAHLEAFELGGGREKAVAQFDNRAAAVLQAAVGPAGPDPALASLSRQALVTAGLLAEDPYIDAPTVYSPTRRCLALLAYHDFFPTGTTGPAVVSAAVAAANPGWCGTFGNYPNDALQVAFGSTNEGNYDLTQMHLIPMAYAYYDLLAAQAREHLINSLLGDGRVHGPGQDDAWTRGPYPDTWSRAGVALFAGLKKSIGETENHILQIMTARYLANQLLYQRSHEAQYDNRRNSRADWLFPGGMLFPDRPAPSPWPGSCAHLLLEILQGFLRNDFSEYNAKSYQRETRNALLNLSSYAYDHEVRLAARIVLDYLSAHFAVSSNDLRRLLPFRRRNEAVHGRNAHDGSGYMTCGVLEWQDGADSMAAVFAVLAGNLRIYQAAVPGKDGKPDKAAWSVPDTGEDQLQDALHDYRLPPSIHDLLVHDSNRRYYQRLRRYIGDSANDNAEIFAGSASYLITAGGQASDYAIDPYFLGEPRGDDIEQQLGVAVTTSFMPTTHRLVRATKADELIQFSSFAEESTVVRNLGVAPDFACGHQIRLPDWLQNLQGTPRYVSRGKFIFVDMRSEHSDAAGRPGFYLAIYREPANGYAFLEAFDTWIKTGSFADFVDGVTQRNPNISLKNMKTATYRTSNNNNVEFVIWDHAFPWFRTAHHGAEVTRVTYASSIAYDGLDSFGDAGNVTDRFLNGSVLNSTGSATVEITNRAAGMGLTLDLSDMMHPQRRSETGEVERAGSNSEVWVDFDWTGAHHGDVYQPMDSVAAAMSLVAGGGRVNILPGQTGARTSLGTGARMTLSAPLGNVKIGVRQ